MGVTIGRDNGASLTFFLFNDRLEGHNERSALSDNGPGRSLGLRQSNGIISDPNGMLSNFSQSRHELFAGNMPINNFRGPNSFKFVLIGKACGRDDRRESRQFGELDD